MLVTSIDRTNRVVHVTADDACPPGVIYMMGATQPGKTNYVRKILEEAAERSPMHDYMRDAMLYGTSFMKCSWDPGDEPEKI